MIKTLFGIAKEIFSIVVEPATVVGKSIVSVVVSNRDGDTKIVESREVDNKEVDDVFQDLDRR